MPSNPNASSEIPVVDLTQPISLFENSTITDDEAGLKLHVPTRLVQSGNYGDWELDVSGKQMRFKEYDDYGAIRVLHNKVEDTCRGIWIPHVFGFEATDSLTNLPEIRDRERLAVEVTLWKVDEEEDTPNLHETGVLLETTYGRFGANAEEGRFFSYPWGHHLLFEEFVCLDTTHVYNENLELPDVEVLSAIDYIERIRAEQGEAAAKEALRGPLPEELQRPGPLPHETRKLNQFESAGHFGALQVPVTELYDPGLKAHITFDMFTSP
jgi:hypothetical protein